MIDDILKEIRDAEDKADEIIKDANQKGKEIVAKAESDAHNQKRATLKECKEDRKLAVDKANTNALLKREDILKKGKVAADKVVEDKKADVEKASDELVHALLEKYCPTCE